VDRLHRDLELNFKTRLLSKEHECDRRLQMQAKETSALADTLEKLSETYKSLKTIANEYERSMAELIQQRDRCWNDYDEALRMMTREREQHAEDVRGVELSFADLHRRYEKMKASVGGLLRNEEALKRALVDDKASL